MSDFNTIKSWVTTHLNSDVDITTISKEDLLELQTLADNENESVSKRLYNALVTHTGIHSMRAISAIRLNSHRARTDDYMDNAFGIVLLKNVPNTTDGVFTIVQAVPDRYVLKTTIVCNSKYEVKSVTHSYLNLFVSDLTKEFMLSGTHNGSVQSKIFEHKAKHDNKQTMDEEQTPGSNDPFTITLPNGKVVEP